MYSNGGTYYKVFKMSEGQLQSALVRSEPVVYPKDTYVETADGTPLLIFDNLENAQAFKKERLQKNPGGRYKIGKVKCYGELLHLDRALRLSAGWRERKKTFWKDLHEGCYVGNYDLEDASAGSIALFGVLKIVEEIAEPLHKTVIVVYTEDDPVGADLHDLLENAVRVKTTSAQIQVPEADPDWQDAAEMENGAMSVSGDSDEDGGIL